MTDLRARAQALLEKLKGHGRAQVCTLEPSDCREAAAVLTELLALMHGPAAGAIAAALRCPRVSHAWGCRCELDAGHDGMCVSAGDAFFGKETDR